MAQWSDSSGKYVYAATGSYEVFFIVSEEGDGPHPDVVRRRSAIELTEEVRGKLENQGIPRQHQHDELAILRARYELDKTTIKGVERNQPGMPALTRERVLGRIATLMTNYKDNGGGELWQEQLVPIKM
jgi:hypothetical protein